jgi:hypothetical protein
MLHKEKKLLKNLKEKRGKNKRYGKKSEKGISLERIENLLMVLLFLVF